jgi:uncharacterized protein
MLSPPLIQAVLEHHSLSPTGMHGVGHWVRVRANGLLLAAETGARVDVVELFALFHDAGRVSDGYDPEHGARGAELARAFRGLWFELDDAGLELLCLACRDHSKGYLDGDLTVQTCWDADRLDLYRFGVGIYPDPALLCTEAARRRETLEEAVARSGLRLPDPSQAWIELAEAARLAAESQRP